MWNIEKQSFIIEGHVVPFTADEVALLTGLPNRGEEITWMTLPTSTISSKDIKTEIFELTRESSPYTMLKTFIMYLCSNLFFQQSNFKVPKMLKTIANNVDDFSSINLAWAIWEWLVEDFNNVSMKISNNRPAGYVNGFVSLLIVSAKTILIKHFN